MQDHPTGITENSAPAFDLAEAVRQLANPGASEPVVEATAAPAPVAEQVGSPAPAESQAAVEESPELTQLRAELEAARTERDSMARRSAESIDWARKGFLRKSDEAARAKALLSRAATSGELDKAELERFLASAADPQPTAPQQSEQELMAIDASRFAFRYGLSEKGIQEFSSWIASPTAQSAIAEDDTVAGNYYQTLRNYYERYREATSRPDPAVAQAAGTIARVQREVARAAASPPSRIMPTDAPQAPAEDPMKLSAQERVDRGIVDGWFKQYSQEWMSK